MSFLSKLFDTTQNYVKVPPGHKVVMIYPVEHHYIHKYESGFYVADIGRSGDYEGVFTALRALAASGGKANVIWIIQGNFLDALEDRDAFLREMKSLVDQSKGRMGHCAVFAYAKVNHEPIMKQVKELGVGVHYSAEDGACFVEVHKPEGIVVGIPGRAYGMSSFWWSAWSLVLRLLPAWPCLKKQSLGRLLRTGHRGPAGIGGLVLQRPDKRAASHEPGMNWPYERKRSLVELVALLADEPTNKNLVDFYRCLLASRVAVRISNPPPGMHPGIPYVTQPGDQLGISSAVGPDGSSMLLVYCYEGVLAGAGVATPGEKEVWMEMEGRRVLELAQTLGFGVIVQNERGGDPTWACVQKQHVPKILTGEFA
jgi:hypothetical protein